MQRFQKILYINDPANRVEALQRTLRLARVNAAQLTIASVTEKLPASLSDLENSLLQLKAEEAQSLLGQMPKEGILIETEN